MKYDTKPKLSHTLKCSNLFLFIFQTIWKLYFININFDEFVM